jgi:hypothetical protein
MDSSVVSDPRFKLLGKRLGVSWRDALGTCFLVWLACYDRRSERMTPDEIDVAAETEAFASAMVSVGLAHYSADRKTVIVHGVTARIKFLKQQSARGKNGGKASGKNRRNGNKDNGIGDEANAEANASGTAQAYSLALAQAQALAPAQKTEDEPAKPAGPVRKRFEPPTVDQVRDYCRERKNTIDPELFHAHYAANGWVQAGGQPIKNWKMAVVTWEKNRRARDGSAAPPVKQTVLSDFDVAHGTYNPTGPFQYRTKKCGDPDCECNQD